MLHITGNIWFDYFLLFAGVVSIIGTVANVRDIIAISKKKTASVPTPQPTPEPQPAPKCEPMFQEYGDLTGKVGFQVQVTCSIELANERGNKVMQHLPVLLGHGDDYHAMLDKAKEVTDKWVKDNGVNYTPKVDQ